MWQSVLESIVSSTMVPYIIVWLRSECKEEPTSVGLLFLISLQKSIKDVDWGGGASGIA